MKPFKLFLFFILFLFLVFALTIFFPEKGIQITSDLIIRFPSVTSFLPDEKPDYKDITGIVKQSVALKADSLLHDTIFQPEIFTNQQFLLLKNNTIIADTLLAMKKKNVILNDTIAAKKNRKKIYSIQFNPGDEKNLYPFFKLLTKLANSDQLIRILHYGDSQIEGDRITSFIRNELQKKFGGAGTGLLSFIHNKIYHYSVQVILSSNWKNYSVLKTKSNNQLRTLFGVMMSYSRFTDTDDIHPENPVTYMGTCLIKNQEFAFPLVRGYKNVKLFYGYNRKPFLLSLIADQNEYDRQIVSPSSELRMLEWSFTSTPQAVEFIFHGEDSPEIFALALDGEKGIAVDNIPLRGSSGLDFTKTDHAIFCSMMNLLNTQLILLQVGVNMVPSMLSDYSHYERALTEQLSFIRSCNPSVPVIILGVSDMARKNNIYFDSYPNIEKIRNAQRNAAFKSHCGFWDTYTAMGGRNSMPSWVNCSPPLAQKDFVHFTPRGARLIAELFLNALLAEYNNFLLNSQFPVNDTIYESTY